MDRMSRSSPVPAFSSVVITRSFLTEVSFRAIKRLSLQPFTALHAALYGDRAASAYEPGTPTGVMAVTSAMSSPPERSPADLQAIRHFRTQQIRRRAPDAPQPFRRTVLR